MSAVCGFGTLSESMAGEAVCSRARVRGWALRDRVSSARSLLALERLFTEADRAFLTHFQASLEFRGPSPPSFVNTDPRFPVSAAVGPLPVREALGTRGRCPAGPRQPRPTGMALPSGTPGTEVGTHGAAGGRAHLLCVASVSCPVCTQCHPRGGRGDVCQEE